MRFLIPVALVLAGCSSVNMSAGKALLVSEAAVTGLNVSATVAAQNGCKGACALSLKGKIDTVNQVVTDARLAYRTGQTALAASKLKDATTQIAVVQSQVGGQ